MHEGKGNRRAKKWAHSDAKRDDDLVSRKLIRPTVSWWISGQRKMCEGFHALNEVIDKR
jgi:hypothetical protein